jgi:hypothetical protein
MCQPKLITPALWSPKEALLHPSAVIGWFLGCGLTLAGNYGITVWFTNGHDYIGLWEVPRAPESLTPYTSLMSTDLFIMTLIIVFLNALAVGGHQQNIKRGVINPVCPTYLRAPAKNTAGLHYGGLPASALGHGAAEAGAYVPVPGASTMASDIGPLPGETGPTSVPLQQPGSDAGAGGLAADRPRVHERPKGQGSGWWSIVPVHVKSNGWRSCLLALELLVVYFSPTLLLLAVVCVSGGMGGTGTAHRHAHTLTRAPAAALPLCAS